MRTFFSRMNPTLRGFLIILAIVALIVVLQLEATVTALWILARVAFILAIAFFVFLTWRERREEISQWPARASIVFYGAALLAVGDIGAYWYGGAHGLQIIAFLGVLVLAALAMWRTWREQHTYT
jgi:small-conductance mechanosensitive channel